MYRLVQFDFNGDNHMFAPISVGSCATGNSTVTTYASNEELVVLINSENEGVFTVSIVDMQGRTVSAQQLSAGEGSSRFGISKEGIAPGIYLVMTSLPSGEVTSEKIFIQ
jgi:hypothetical protein